MNRPTPRRPGPDGAAGGVKTRDLAAAAPADEQTGPKPPSAAHRFMRDRPAAVALTYLVLLVAAAALAPLLATHDPNAQQLASRLSPPSAENWLGTDEFGRDQMSRLLYGARVSLLAATQAVTIGALAGVPTGALSGYLGGVTDAMLGRLMDVLMGVPGIVLALTVVAVLGRDITTAMVAVGVILVPRFHRVARAATRDLRHETFVEASRTIGCTPGRVLGRHVLPNILPVLVVQISITLGVAVTAEASLSFLGLGVRPPDPSWGSMLNTAYANMTIAPYLVYAPGLAITLTVLALTVAGDGLRKTVRIRHGAERNP
jgi:ABC-type dipeptide/oligopeptide/nickel transport system permease subunit